MDDRHDSSIDERKILTLHPTRELKIARIKEIEKKLEKMEIEDEHNDPALIEAHVRLTRGFRMGCGVFLVSLTAMCVRIFMTGPRYGAVKFLALVLGLSGAIMFMRGVLYRPDKKLIQESYQPHRGTAEYRSLVNHLDFLARALSHDLQAEDVDGGS